MRANGVMIVLKGNRSKMQRSVDTKIVKLLQSDVDRLFNKPSALVDTESVNHHKDTFSPSVDAPQQVYDVQIPTTGTGSVSCNEDSRMKLNEIVE